MARNYITHTIKSLPPKPNDHRPRLRNRHGEIIVQDRDKTRYVRMRTYSSETGIPLSAISEAVRRREIDTEPDDHGGVYLLRNAALANFRHRFTRDVRRNEIAALRSELRDERRARRKAETALRHTERDLARAERRAAWYWSVIVRAVHRMLPGIQRIERDTAIPRSIIYGAIRGGEPRPPAETPGVWADDPEH